MATTYTKLEIIEQLRAIQEGLKATVQTMTPAQFNRTDGVEWSAAGYLQHLILSNKPLAKALGLGAAQVASMFGSPDHTSCTYDELVATYQKRINEGVRAEDFNVNVPTQYRFPEGVTDQQAYLVQTWEDANHRLFAALEGWSEADLDTHQLPHPAVGLITVREILYFTMYHNTLHWQDMQRVGALEGASQA